jgi:hypothetical protein
MSWCMNIAFVPSPHVPFECAEAGRQPARPAGLTRPLGAVNRCTSRCGRSLSFSMQGVEWLIQN